MNIQIIGTKKCRDTQKAERFFKERRIPFHFKDLKEKNISKGELENITRSIPIDELIDKESKYYQQKGLQFMVFDVEEKLLEDYQLVRTPIVRNGMESTVGYEPELWLKWLREK